MSELTKHVVVSAMIAASMAATAQAHAADDIFIKLDGIPGDSQDSKHRGEIDVLSWSWGASNSVSASIGSGSGAGRAQFKELTITKRVDGSSPRLMQSVAAGERIKTLQLVVRRAGGSATEYIRIKLTDVMVSSVSGGGTAKAPEPTSEEVKFVFTQCEFSFFQQKPDGTVGPEVKMAWNVKNNVKL